MGYCEPNRNLIRSALDRMSEKYFPWRNMQNALPGSRSAFLIRSAGIALFILIPGQGPQPDDPIPLREPIAPAVSAGSRQCCSRLTLSWVYSEGHPSGNRPLIGSGFGIRMDFDDQYAMHPSRPMHAVWLPLQGFTSWQAACNR